MVDKLCVNCKYLTGLLVCTSPQNGMSKVTGGGKPVLASLAREGICGAEGLNYVEKEKKAKKWYEFM